MIEFGKEYFKKPYYFFLKDKGDMVSVYYSSSETITEAKDNDEIIDVPKKDLPKLKSFIGSVLKSDKLPSSEFITKKMKSFKKDAIKELKETRLLVKLVMKMARKFLKDKDLKDFELDKEDVKFMKEQSKDVLKLIPIIALQLFPGSTLATPFILELGKKLGIKLSGEMPKKYEEEGEKEGGEIEELVDADGSFVGSSIPMLQQNWHPKKDTDQYVRMAHASQWPYLRIYYGESEEKEGDVLPEVDFSDTFGYDETEDLDYTSSIKKLKDMGVDNPKERTDVFGKMKGQKRKKKGRKKGWLKQRLVELGDEKMEEMIDEILVSKKKKDGSVVKKENGEDESVIEKLLLRNIDSIKKIADKEDIDINKLIKRLKIGE